MWWNDGSSLEIPRFTCGPAQEGVIISTCGRRGMAWTQTSVGVLAELWAGATDTVELRSTAMRTVRLECLNSVLNRIQSCAVVQQSELPSS